MSLDNKCEICLKLGRQKCSYPNLNSTYYNSRLTQNHNIRQHTLNKSKSIPYNNHIINQIPKSSLKNSSLIVTESNIIHSNQKTINSSVIHQLMIQQKYPHNVSRHIVSSQLPINEYQLKPPIKFYYQQTNNHGTTLSPRNKIEGNYIIRGNLKYPIYPVYQVIQQPISTNNVHLSRGHHFNLND